MADRTPQPLAIHHLSHDLRGPLNTILGFAELLLDGIEGPLNETQQADITAIYTSAQRLLQLVNAMVDWSKLEGGQLALEMQPVDISTLIEKIRDSGVDADRAAPVKVQYNLPSELPPVAGDEGRIEQMVASIIRFGLEHTKTGPVKVTARADAQQVTVQVKIQGLQLTAKQATDLLEPIAYVDATGHSKPGPGGIDLPLTRLLAERLGGQLRAEFWNDEVTFHLTLPVYSDNPLP